ncbi:MAG: LexA family protein [Candidatus Muiribacteriota bacterium]
MINLTEKQHNFLTNIMTFQKKQGYPPSISDLCKILGVSIGTVQQYFFALEKKGYIKRENNKGRGLKITAGFSYTDENYINIPIISDKLPDKQSFFSRENIIGNFKFPDGLFPEKKIYSVFIKKNFILFTPLKNKKNVKKNSLFLIIFEGEMLIKKGELPKKADLLGKVIYVLSRK